MISGRHEHECRICRDKGEDAGFKAWWATCLLNDPVWDDMELAACEGFAAGRAAERAEVVAMVQALCEDGIDPNYDVGYHLGYRMACNEIIQRLTAKQCATCKKPIPAIQDYCDDGDCWEVGEAARIQRLTSRGEGDSDGKNE